MIVHSKGFKTRKPKRVTIEEKGSISDQLRSNRDIQGILTGMVLGDANIRIPKVVMMLNLKYSKKDREFVDHL